MMINKRLKTGSRPTGDLYNYTQYTVYTNEYVHSMALKQRWQSVPFLQFHIYSSSKYGVNTFVCMNIDLTVLHYVHNQLLY